jgi:phosphotransferase system enzyme I (PtsI)
MKNKTHGNILRGIAAAPGIAIGHAHLYHRISEEVEEAKIENIEEAKKSLEDAFAKSKKELTKIFRMAMDKIGEKRAAIFEAQLMILDDPILKQNILNRIEEERKSPEFIVNDEITKYQQIMRESEIEYLQERSYDIEDIKNRIIRNLRQKKWTSRIKEDVIVVSQNLTPADTILFNRVNSRGYITDFGGLTSHAAIVARSLNIPAVVGVHDASSKIKEGDLLIVDGFHGEVIINPTPEQLEYYRKKIDELEQYDEELEKLRTLPTVTKDGRKIKITANLDLMKEIELAVINRADGVGLVRTEQIFDLFDAFPDEEEQFEVYKRLAEKIYPESVIIRAFDIGGDKVLPIDLKEPNPFLGWRGIRFLLDNEELFKSQIKAILRANVHHNLRFMIPMVSSPKEVEKTRALIDKSIEELKSEGKKFNSEIKLGIMVEIPSAAVTVPLYAERVDFLSIGTNDLIQYLLAVDRGNEIVSELYQEFHPAVVRTLKYIIKSGKEAGLKTTICGEMAADPLAIPLLIGLGLESISVSPAAILTARKIIRNISYSEVEKLADRCLELNSEEAIRKELEEFYDGIVDDELKKLI